MKLPRTTSDDRASMDGESNFSLRAMAGVAVLMVAVVVWHQLRPHSTFAADGLDSDWDASVRSSHDRNEPGVVLYTAGWCPACQALHAGALADPAVWRELQHRTFVTVDLTNPTAAGRAHQRAAGVSAIPTLIRYDRDGHETGRTHGMPAPDLIAWLQDGE